MKAIHNFWLLFVTLFLTFSQIYSQENVLQMHIENAEVVVEATVISQEGFFDSEERRIFTANELRIKHRFKGNHQTTIFVRTEGGKVEDLVAHVSHATKLSVGESGIFLLQKVRKGDEMFTFINGDFGKIKRLAHDSKNEGYYSGTREKFKSWRQLREQIGLWCGQNLTIQPIKSENEILQMEQGTQLCISLANPIPDFENNQISFDLMAKSSTVGLSFAKAEVFLDYPVEPLGSSIVSSGNITATKETITTSSSYQLGLSDETSAKLKLEISTDCQPSTIYYVLDTVYEKLAHLTLNVQDWVSLGSINLESFEAEGNAQYYVNNGGCVDFGRVCAEGEIGVGDCSISSVEMTPFGGGIGQIMTIRGNGFDNGVLGRIFIPDADDGGGSELSILGIDSKYIEDWTNDSIKIKILSNGPNGHPFGSGLWRIQPDLGMGFCSKTIEIDYSLLNTDDDKMVGLALNPAVAPNGTYQWWIDGDINSDPVLQAKGITFDMVRAVAEEAFCDWEMATGIDFKYMGALPSAQNVLDDRSVIMFEDISAGGNTTRRFLENFCTDDEPYIDGRFREADIVLNRANNWFVSTDTAGITIEQTDLYSVLIHEIGHAVLLNHAMDTIENDTDDDRIMYYLLKTKQIKRDIDNKSLDGVGILVQRTQEAMMPGRCLIGFELDTSPEGCMTNTIEQMKTICSVRIPTLISRNDEIWIELNNHFVKNITLADAFGTIVFHHKNRFFNGDKINIGNLSAGIYFLNFNCDGKLHSEKIIVH